MTDADRLLHECLKLEPAERARLIDALQATLPPDMGAVSNEWPDDYHAEISRRLSRARAGTASLIPAADLLARLKA